MVVALRRSVGHNGGVQVIEAIPRLRGVSHQYAFFVALPAAAVLISMAAPGPPTWAATIYGICLCLLLGISALYHRRKWSLEGRRRMRRLDHSMIFVFIAGTFTPFPMLTLEPDIATTLLVAMWATVGAGLVFKQLWLEAPDWLSAALYVAAGLIILPYTGELVEAIGATGVWLLGLGGLFFIVGAVVYATHWPNPNPSTFGYHEVFHVFVLAGVLIHYVAIAAYAVRIV